MRLLITNYEGGIFSKSSINMRLQQFKQSLSNKSIEIRFSIAKTGGVEVEKANVVKSAKQLINDLLEARSANERTRLRTTSRPA